MSAGQRHPAPAINRDFAFLYDGFGKHELRVQKCLACGELRHPPSPFCPACHSPDWEAIVASGRGALYSYTIHYHPPIPPWELPHPVGLGAMEEGFRFVAAMPGLGPAALQIGAPLHVVFVEVVGGQVLPEFRLGAGP